MAFFFFFDNTFLFYIVRLVYNLFGVLTPLLCLSLSYGFIE